MVLIKIQRTEIHELNENQDLGGSMTIGKYIDEIIAQGPHANKLTVDFDHNPEEIKPQI